MEIVKGANLAVRFLLELCALAALGYWGFHAGGGRLARIGLGIGVPLVAAVAWATFVAPGASARAPTPLRVLLELALFGMAAASLAATGHRTLAGALVLAYAINRGLMAVWEQ